MSAPKRPEPANARSRAAGPAPEPADTRLRVAGRAKGFVDLQVNGFQGIDFSSLDLELDDCHRITEALAARGTVAYCATLITCSPEVYRRNLPILARAMEEPGVRGRMLGIHLEGPYLSPVEGARGAHDGSKMKDPDPGELDRFQEWANGTIALLTLAPERPGAIDFIAHVRARHATRVALGHHLAPRQTIHDAVAAGATLSTHLGNGCPNLLPRHSNILLHQLAHDGLTAGIITDGHHLPEDLIRIVFRCKGASRIFIVSDAAPIAGYAPGIYETLGNRVRLTPEGRIESLDGSHLAGAACTLADCMRHLRSLRVASDDELWQVGYGNPLAILGVSLDGALVDSVPDFTF